MTQNHEIVLIVDVLIVLTLQNGKLRARCDTTDCVLTNTSIVLHLSLDNISLHFVDLHRDVMHGCALLVCRVPTQAPLYFGFTWIGRAQVISDADVPVADDFLQIIKCLQFS